MSATGSVKSSPGYAPEEEAWPSDTDFEVYDPGLVLPPSWPFGAMKESDSESDFDRYGDRIFRYNIMPSEEPQETWGESFYYYTPEEEQAEGGAEEDMELDKRSRSMSRSVSRSMSRSMSRSVSKSMSRPLSRRSLRAPNWRMSKKLSKKISAYAVLKKEKREKKRPETRPKSLFVHSSPINFQDMTKASRSAYGTTFLRSTGDTAEDAVLMRTLTDSSFATLQSFLSSFDRILSAPFADQHRKHLTNLYKESLVRNLERYGITSTISDGGLHWHLYPTTHNYLFSIHVGDHIHQTRVLSRIEERLLSGHVQRLRLPYAWPTESVWTGHWDLLGMSGAGTYSMPHGVTYQGKMLDGMFHDSNATLTYPNQFKAINCVFEKGKLLSCQFQFPDALVYSSSNPEEWDYCRFPDRRFWSEVQNGLKPAKISQKTEIDPPRRIAPGCYDTNDGFYDPQTLMLISPNGELLRVPTCEEAMWIQQYCRKGFFEPADFRPDLFENWYNFDKEFIDLILSQQAKYRRGKITYHELQQFYADFDMLPSWSPYKKRRYSKEIELENFIKSIPSPKVLATKFVKKFKGHKIHDISNTSARSSHSGHSEKSRPPFAKESKSQFKIQDDSSQRIQTPGGLSLKASKISFKLTQDPQDSKEGSYNRLLMTGQKRAVPEKFLEYAPVLDPPFAKPRPQTPFAGAEDTETKAGKCPSAVSDYSKRADSSLLGEYHDEQWDRAHLTSWIRSLIWGLVDDILIKEREKHRKRLKWAQNQPKAPSEGKRLRPVINENCLKILEDLFDSIPDREEFCDSDPSRTCDLKKLAQDKYRVLQYWGTRMFTLEFKN